MLKKGWLHLVTLQEITWIISILTFLGGIVTFLFKKIVINPLQVSIDNLNSTLKDFKKTTDKELEIHEREIDLLKDKTTRHETQLNFLLKGGERDG